MRPAVVGVVTLVPLLVATAPPMSSNERAYTLTLMCTALASEYGNDADKLRTMDAARKMARAQGYDDRRLSRDVITMASVVGAKLHDNPNAMDENRLICRRLGLVS